jgi:hypothetical protein
MGHGRFATAMSLKRDPGTFLERLRGSSSEAGEVRGGRNVRRVLEVTDVELDERPLDETASSRVMPSIAPAAHSVDFHSRPTTRSASLRLGLRILERVRSSVPHVDDSVELHVPRNSPIVDTGRMENDLNGARHVGISRRIITRKWREDRIDSGIIVRESTLTITTPSLLGVVLPARPKGLNSFWVERPTELNALGSFRGPASASSWGIDLSGSRD